MGGSPFFVFVEGVQVVRVNEDLVVCTSSGRLDMWLSCAGALRSGGGDLRDVRAVVQEERKRGERRGKKGRRAGEQGGGAGLQLSRPRAIGLFLFFGNDTAERERPERWGGGWTFFTRPCGAPVRRLL